MVATPITARTIPAPKLALAEKHIKLQIIRILK
jgi:hypothetical protein